MAKRTIQNLTLDHPVVYQIMVPGFLDEKITDWVTGMKLKAGSDDGLPVTTLIVSVDQAALQGLLRRLYSLGLPIISVTCIDFNG